MIQNITYYLEKITKLFREEDFTMDEETLRRFHVLSSYIQKLPSKNNPSKNPLTISEGEESFFSKHTEQCVFCKNFFRMKEEANHLIICNAFSAFKKKMRRVRSYTYYDGRGYTKAAFESKMTEIKKEDPDEYRRIQFMFEKNISALD